MAAAPSVRPHLCFGLRATGTSHAGKNGLATIECTKQRLVLRAGTTTLVLDKEAGTARLQRKALLWDRKPVTVALDDISGVAVAPAFERSCGVASSYLLLATHSRTELGLPPLNKADAEQAADGIRAFLGLQSSF